MSDVKKPNAVDYLNAMHDPAHADPGSKPHTLHCGCVPELQQRIAALEAALRQCDEAIKAKEDDGWHDSVDVWDKMSEARKKAKEVLGETARTCPHGQTGPCSVCGDQG